MIFDEEMENEDEDRKEKDVIEDFFLVSTLFDVFRKYVVHITKCPCHVGC